MTAFPGRSSILQGLDDVIPMIFVFVADPKIVGRIATLRIIKLLYIRIHNENGRAVELKLFLRKYHRLMRRRCRERDHSLSVCPQSAVILSYGI